MECLGHMVNREIAVVGIAAEEWHRCAHGESEKRHQHRDHAGDIGFLRVESHGPSHG